MSSPLRERRRAAATREILDAARHEIAEHGPSGLALRSVARRLGMTVQALYHYFPSRDELITALITEAYGELADAVEAATGFLAAAEAFRAWAIGNAAPFRLIYGTPLPHYAAPAHGRTTAAATRLATVFIRAMFGGYRDDQLARADFPGPLEGLPPWAFGDLPRPAAALFVSAWGHLHGLVVLEAFGHTAFIGPAQEEIFRGAMRNLLADVHRRIPD